MRDLVTRNLRRTAWTRTSRPLTPFTHLLLFLWTTASTTKSRSSYCHTWPTLCRLCAHTLIVWPMALLASTIIAGSTSTSMAKCLASSKASQAFTYQSRQWSLKRLGYTNTLFNIVAKHCTMCSIWLCAEFIYMSQSHIINWLGGWQFAKTAMDWFRLTINVQI